MQRNAEVVAAQMTHRLLKVILRRRAHANLVGLNRGLHFLQLQVLEELDDFP